MRTCAPVRVCARVVHTPVPAPAPAPAPIPAPAPAPAPAPHQSAPHRSAPHRTHADEQVRVRRVRCGGSDAGCIRRCDERDTGEDDEGGPHRKGRLYMWAKHAQHTCGQNMPCIHVGKHAPYTHMYTHVCEHVCMPVHMLIYTWKYIPVYMWVHMPAYMWVHMPHLYACRHTRRCGYIHPYCTLIYLSVYTSICTPVHDSVLHVGCTCGCSGRLHWYVWSHRR